MTKIVLQESGYEFELTDQMLAEMAKYGDVPADWGVELDDCVFVSADYARNDPHWDVPDGYPDYLPLWEQRI